MADHSGVDTVLLPKKSPLRNCLPAGDESPRFDPRLLKRVGHFAAGMSGIALTAIVLTQFDRVVLVNSCPLNSLATTWLREQLQTASIIVSPVFNAVSPPFFLSRRIRQDGQPDHALSSECSIDGRAGSPPRITAVHVFPGITGVMDGERRTCKDTGAVLCLLLIGRMVNGLMHIPYALQLAYGWSGLGLRINIFLITVFVPGVLLLTNQYGALGAASMWAGVISSTCSSVSR